MFQHACHRGHPEPAPQEPDEVPALAWVQRLNHPLFDFVHSMRCKRTTGQKNPTHFSFLSRLLLYISLMLLTGIAVIPYITQPWHLPSSLEHREREQRHKGGRQTFSPPTLFYSPLFENEKQDSYYHSSTSTVSSPPAVDVFLCVRLPHRRVTFSTANQAQDLQDPSQHSYYDSGLEESETPSSKSSSGPRIGPLALPEDHYERTTPDGSIGEMEHPENGKVSERVRDKRYGERNEERVDDETRAGVAFISASNGFRKQTNKLSNKQTVHESKQKKGLLNICAVVRVHFSRASQKQARGAPPSHKASITPSFKRANRPPFSCHHAHIRGNESNHSSQMSKQAISITATFNLSRTIQSA
ncbi:hypothetical protein E1301_Tti004096 [Triplophysa tibetana]|uniref:Transmembrane protein n=1 Tax=Triplophysa tibetana TaxID=1572043 RepID=A0A5A9NKG5_9TELE|nr:hypothetical protein E1301_Tti004096 [Triplophysa tibetana]